MTCGRSCASSPSRLCLPQRSDVLWLTGRSAICADAAPVGRRGPKRRVAMIRLKDRNEAGRFLAERLSAYANRPDTLALALPRGGVPVAYEVAKAFGAPLDVFLVRKLELAGPEGV